MFVKLYEKYLCAIGRHDKLFWTDHKCEDNNAMTGIFRPYKCSRCGFESTVFEYPEFPMPKVKQPKS